MQKFLAFLVVQKFLGYIFAPSNRYFTENCDLSFLFFFLELANRGKRQNTGTFIRQIIVSL